MSRGLSEVLRPPDYILYRVAGLSDEEMLWEPVHGCLSIRQADGVWKLDDPPRVAHFDGQVGPVTTIAWRLVHLARDVLSADRNAVWLGVESPQPRPEPANGAGIPANARDMIAWLSAAHHWWADLIASCDDEHRFKMMGPVAGPWDGARAGFVTYINMELTHHGAEVGLLRDLWAASRGA